jgi:hypothetical protein
MLSPSLLALSPLLIKRRWYTNAGCFKVSSLGKNYWQKRCRNFACEKSLRKCANTVEPGINTVHLQAAALEKKVFQEGKAAKFAERKKRMQKERFFRIRVSVRYCDKT